MAIEIKCDCGAAYRLDDSRGGQEFTCKVCQATMYIPAGVPRVTTGGAPARAPSTANRGATAAERSAAPPSSPGPTDPALGNLDAMSEPDETISSDPQEQRTRAISSARAIQQPGAVRATADLDSFEKEDRERKLPRRMPGSWFVVRLAMWALCAAMLTMPWFTLTARDQATGRSVRAYMPGWQAALSGWEDLPRLWSGRLGGMPGLLDTDGIASASGLRPVKAPPYRPLTSTDNTTRVGRSMLAGGPLLFAALVLTAPFILALAYLHRGRGGSAPFVLCMIGLGVFLLSWQVLPMPEARWEAMAPAGRVTLEAGHPKWVYPMTGMLAVMSVLAGMRPWYEQSGGKGEGEPAGNAGAGRQRAVE